jgi:hypothetical protein
VLPPTSKKALLRDLYSIGVAIHAVNKYTKFQDFYRLANQYTIRRQEAGQVLTGLKRIPGLSSLRSRLCATEAAAGVGPPCVKRLSDQRRYDAVAHAAHVGFKV